MRFITKSECHAWLTGRRREVPSSDAYEFSHREWFPKDGSRLCYVSRQIAVAMMEVRQPCLLWIQETDIWEANLHLYYRLRASYGEGRSVEDAPGHLFYGYEVEDLATFLFISLLNGWGGLILTHYDYINGFFSHDNFIDIFARHEETIAELRKAFEIPRTT